MPKPSHEPAMPAKGTPKSAGILLYRRSTGDLEVMLAHPGGPYFVRKDEGAWTIPKGLMNSDETPEAAAMREFEEEVGWRPAGELAALGEVRLKSGKRLIAFAVESDENLEELNARFSPGIFRMEWPPRSAQYADFPEVDRIEWFSLSVAKLKINAAQVPLLNRLTELVETRPTET